MCVCVCARAPTVSVGYVVLCVPCVYMLIFTVSHQFCRKFQGSSLLNLCWPWTPFINCNIFIGVYVCACVECRVLRVVRVVRVVRVCVCVLCVRVCVCVFVGVCVVVTSLAVRVLSAVAHTRSLPLRDIKPDNILIDRYGHIKLTVCSNHTRTHELTHTHTSHTRRPGLWVVYWIPQQSCGTITKNGERH